RAVEGMRRVSVLCVFLLVVLWPSAASFADERADGAPLGERRALPVRVAMSVEPAVATVGDRLHLRIDVDRANGVAVAFPDVVARIAPFDVLDAVIAEPVTGNDRTIERRDYIIAAFETGELYVPVLAFEYVTADGDTGVAFGDSLLVSIESVLPEVREDEEVGPKDIKPPVELPRRIWPFIVAALVAAAAAAAFYFVRRWLRSRTSELASEVVEEPVVPRIAAHVVALERLDALAREDPIGRGEIPRFYVRATEIVRLYLRDRFGVDAIDMTTSEMPPAMRKARIDEGEIGWSEGFLLHADLAKFARHVPSEARARSDFAEAREFVERTRLRGETIVEGGGGAQEPGGTGAGEDEPTVGGDAGEVTP
ncbi:hypothetical protein KAW64_10350, partial [bacterium]|nr:hypothetical protein [bacterium]